MVPESEFKPHVWRRIFEFSALAILDEVLPQLRGHPQSWLFNPTCWACERSHNEKSNLWTWFVPGETVHLHIYYMHVYISDISIYWRFKVFNSLKYLANWPTYEPWIPLVDISSLWNWGSTRTNAFLATFCQLTHRMSTQCLRQLGVAVNSWD